MRILLVTDERGTKNIPGGGLNHLMYVARPASALGHEIEFLTADEYRGKFISPSVKDNIMEKLKNKIKEFNPDVVNFFNNCIWGFDVFELCDKLGVPSVLTSPDYAPICKNRMLLKSNDMRVMCNLDNDCNECINQRMGVPAGSDLPNVMKGRQIIVASNFLKDMYIKGGFEEENVEMIEYGLNPSFFAPIYGGTNGEIMNITRMSPEKGLDLYIRLSKMIPELKWKLAGYPSSDMSSYPSIDYLGELTEKDKIFFLRNSEMFVSTPRWYEPAGGTYLEAKALGRPVVTFALGGLKQYHSEGGAVLIEYDKLDDMAEAVKRLHFDEDLRIKLGKEGRKQIEERNNENILIHKTLAVYDKLRGAR